MKLHCPVCGTTHEGAAPCAKPRMTIRKSTRPGLWEVIGRVRGRAPKVMARRTTRAACETFVRDAHVIFARCGVK
jgi:hypothetical protein